VRVLGINDLDKCVAFTHSFKKGGSVVSERAAFRFSVTLIVLKLFSLRLPSYLPCREDVK